MKTTLVIDDVIMRRLRVESARRGETISELVESALRLLLEPSRETQETADRLPPLPSFDGGGALVDIADRHALLAALEGR